MRLWFLLFVAVLACGPSKEAQRKERDEAIRAQLETHRADLGVVVHKVIDKAVSYKTPLTEDKINDVPVLDLTDRGNAILITEWSAQALLKGTYRDAEIQKRDVTPLGVHVGRLMSIADTTDFVNKVAPWVMDGSGSKQSLDVFSTSDADALVKRIEGIQLVLVIRVLEMVQPQFAGTGTGTFTPGHLVGEARVFDLKGMDHGGIRFAAKSSSEIKYATNRTATALEDDLYGSAGLALSDGLQKQISKLSKAPSSF